MIWVADLSPWDVDGVDSSHLRAVGWLAPGRAFTTGEVSEQVFAKLCELLKHSWQPPYFPYYPDSPPPCGLCSSANATDIHRFTHGMGWFNGFNIPRTSDDCLCVPGNGIIYISPVPIAHYINSHAYQPPDEFCQAVLRCPPMNTFRYFKELIVNGGRGIFKDWLS
jgi:hypothetical protein